MRHDIDRILRNQRRCRLDRNRGWLRLPVVLVVGLRLGCLNHALLNAQAIARAGAQLAGWRGSAIDPGMPALIENIEPRRLRLSAPQLGLLPGAACNPVRLP